MIRHPNLLRAGPVKGLAHAFTMVELLACVAVIAVLVTLVGSQVGQAFDRTKNLKCVSLMRKVGSAIQQYSLDNNNEFPRSSHSAWSLGKKPWGSAILPYLQGEESTTVTEAAFAKITRCPADKRVGNIIRSYGLNVFFQLGSGDSYVGAPTTWWTYVTVPRPAATILVAENNSGADHFMSHEWSSTVGIENEWAIKRHGKTSNYLFVDGHVESLPIEAVFDPAKNINKWNPGLAN